MANILSKSQTLNKLYVVTIDDATKITIKSSRPEKTTYPLG